VFFLFLDNRSRDVGRGKDAEKANKINRRMEAGKKGMDPAD
jgi:hypothetical protein